MRIISGTSRGRVVHAPKNLPVRPTTDFAKESIFNIINNYFELDGLKVADLFCGTGNISYEFASRGCTEITAVDSNFNCCEFVKKTASAFKMEAIKVMKADVFGFLKKTASTFHIIFADPPYELEQIKDIPPLVFEKGLLKRDGWLIVEHGPDTDLSALTHFKEKRTYGHVNFSIFTIPTA
ncbi:MAG TPA: RsmD family RNA methyltransferase [Bacteroidia bacterium]|jgi:16S rRNA (guanine(966)-N(2))-methyltransferase RsmD|nr:RsmD family RNA methyltransferase [Bacteroidia bacterium]